MREKLFPQGEYVVSSSIMVVRREDAKIIFNGSSNIMMPDEIAATFEECKGIANLLAAAPRLLASIENLLPYMDGATDTGPQFDRHQSLELKKMINDAKSAMSQAYGETE